MKKSPQRQLFRILCLVGTLGFMVFGILGCKKSEEMVQLRFASWRIDDVAKMDRINALFTKAHPNISISFDSYDPILYESITKDQLVRNEGADILFLNSYDKGRALFNAGYLYDLTNVIPSLASFSPIPLQAWSTENGVTYGVPSVGVTHGIYYQKSLFEKYNILEPVTWDEFIAACEKLLTGGETVIAQGALDTWTLNRVVFCGLGANFYGGETARKGLMARTMKLTNSNFIDAFKAVESLKKYLPNGFASLGYEDSRKLFASGKAAMFIGGSWEINVFEALGANSSTIGWFAPPVKKGGDRLQYCFHVDAAIGLNKNSKHLKAALEYIKWTAGSEYAQSFMSELPGFFSYTPGTINLTNPLAGKMYTTASAADLTVRLMSEKLNAQSPTGEDLLNEALQGLMIGNYTAEAAAAYVQEQLDTWYK